MGVELKGEAALMQELERRFGQARTDRISDAALEAGAKVFKDELKRQFETFKDTGASIDEITVSSPRTVGGKRQVSIHWKGPKGRYRVIHLNEFGTVNNPSPRGKGAVARALRNAERAYRNAIKRELEVLARG